MKILSFFAAVVFFVCSDAFAQLPARPEKLKRADCFFGVHFDLHASEDIADAGKSLTYEMVDTFLTRVRPDFIQIDCKGHPGITSYPTKVGYHVAGFEKDPLRLFRDVTAKNNVALFMHFSGVWDGKVVKEHPDWAVVKASGERSTQKVSFFSPYLDKYMIPQLRELAGEYKVDGAWIDGECWAVEPDYCEASVKEFRSRTGITEIPRKPSEKYWSEWMEYTRSLFRTHLAKYVDAIHASDPGFQVTSNWAYSSMMPEKVTADVDYLSGDVTPQNGVYRSAFEARCLAPQGKPWDLMAWGFSWNGADMPMSVKSAVQLKQEAAEIIAMGGGVQFYFQQNRDLSIKPWLAEMLDDIGSFCRQRQPYTHKSVPVPQVALLYPSEYYQMSSPVPYSRSLSALQGTLYSILDGQYCVEVLMEHHLAGNMNKYPLIVVPECGYLDGSFADELKKYVTNGGKLLVIGAETAGLFRNELGLAGYSRKEKRQLFFSTGGRIGSARSESAEISLMPGAEILSEFYSGSDFRAPSGAISASINELGKGKIAGIYFNVGSCYNEYKTFVLRDYLSGIISVLFPDPGVKVTGSHLVHVTCNRLNGKTYVNLINTAGEHTNQAVTGYDQVPPLDDIEISVRTGSRPESIILQPGGTRLKYKYKAGVSTIKLPRIGLHSILEIV